MTMKTEEFAYIRGEMSKVFAENLGKLGPEKAADASVVIMHNWLIARLMTKVENTIQAYGKQECCGNGISGECCGDPDLYITADAITEALMEETIRDPSGNPILPSGLVLPPGCAPVPDGRPVGWTEALCLRYISELESNGTLTSDLATYFVHGDWKSIFEQHQPFVDWMQREVKL